ncbi:NGCA protein, partial [Serilophus lunatus]|nr:NGCA protein [Serilophus lunatus]
PPAVQQPPELTEQPPEQLVVFPSDDVVLKCAATGNPPVEFPHPNFPAPFKAQILAGREGWRSPPGEGGEGLDGWEAGEPPDRGSLPVLGSPQPLWSPDTPQWPKEKVTPVEVEEGDPVVLPCDPPKSAVAPKIYWLNSRIVHIAQDARVSMGQDGFLYFANAQVGDSHPDYICHAHYLGPRTIIQKEPLDLRVAPSEWEGELPQLPWGTPGGPAPHTPGALSPAGVPGPLSPRCAPSPTPWVHWRRLNGPLPPGRAALDNFNKTLRLREVEEADDGEYECVAENSQGQARRSHLVTVEGTGSTGVLGGAGDGAG